ncbi:MAG: DoxX family membrane protein [Patescibacteria group bacterium]
MDSIRLPSFLLRTGIALTLLYAATASFLDPNSWIGYLPAWMRSIIPAEPLLIAFSLFEIALGLWLISGKHARYAGALAALTMFGITITNITNLDIVFRDIGLLAAALAIVALHRKESPNP